MNEEALEYSFNLFKADGYNGTLEDYKALINENKEALDYSYGLFSSDGYNGSVEDFSTLVGVGNQQGPAKETANVGSVNQAVDTDSSSENGSLGSQKYDAATQINQDEINLINDEVSQISFEPITESVYTPGGYMGYGGGYKEVKKQPYKEYLDQAKKSLEKNKKEGEEVTQEKIEDYARFLIKQEKEFDILKKKNKDYLKELSDEERIAIGQEKAELYIKQQYEIEEDLEAITIAAEKYNNGANVKNLDNWGKILSDPDAIVDVTYARENNEPLVQLKDGRVVPEAFIEAYNEAYAKHEAHVAFMKKAVKDYEDKIDSQPELAKDVDFLKRNYDRLDKLYQVAYDSVAEAGIGQLNTFLDVSEMITGEPASMGSVINKENINAVRKEMQRKAREDYAHSVKFEDAFSSAENFGEWATESLAGQVGTLAQLASGNYVGLTSIGLGSYGRTISDIEIADEENGTETSNLNKRLTALGYSVAEVGLGALPTMRILSKSSKAFGDISMRNFTKGVGNYVSKNWKALPDAAITEFVSEGATSYVQNGLDIIGGRRDIQNIWEGVLEASVTGGMFGVTLGGMPLLKGMGLAAFSDYSKYEQFRDNAETIGILNKEISGMDKRTKAYKDRVKLINDLTASNSDILNTIEANIENNLSPEGFRLYQQATTEQEQIRLQAEQIQNNNNLSRKEKNTALDKLKQRFDYLQAGRNIYKKDFGNIFNIETENVQNKYTDLAEKELLRDNITDPNKIKKKAQELYSIDKIKDRNQKAIDAIKKLKAAGIINNYNYTESNTELLELLKDDLDSQVESGSLSQNQAKEIYRDAKRKISEGKLNGFNLTNIENNKIKSYNIYVSQENALKNGKTETAIHELGHSIFIESLGTNPDAYNGLANDILNYLNKNNKSAYNRIVAQTTGQSADEILTNFLEEVSSGRLELEAAANKGFVATLALKLRNIFSEVTNTPDVFTFKGVTDATTFLTELGNKLATGTLSVKDVKTIQQEGIAGKKLKDLKEAKAELFKSEQADVQSALNALEDRLMDNSIDYDTYEREVEKLEKQFEAAEKKATVEKAKPKRKEKKTDENLKQATARSKKILDRIGNDPKGYNPNNSKIVEVLSGMIESKSKAFRTKSGAVVNLNKLPGFEMENMIAETIAGMVPLINKFDPGINNSLYGYLNSQLANKMRGALKSGKVTDQAFTEDVSTAKGITAEETTTKQPEKPKYVKIMDADVFDTKVINAISDKMVSTVRILKNKLIAALGKNQNTSPLIAEILSDISTQADIDIKKAMGGKKDGALRKFLLKNKQAIIENSTTTFLMGKDQGNQVLGGLPIAIQKQVDGKFLSYPDWIGKKIDRETTEKRGATAGNQIVRRVPANRISDADYLSFFLQPTGNPIRGRKEALAKELSGELGLELFVEAIESGGGPIFDAFEGNRERMGEVLGDYYAGEVIKQAERGVVKFSVSQDVIIETFKELSGRTEFQTTKNLDRLYKKYPNLRDQIEEEIVRPYKNLWKRINELVKLSKDRDKKLNRGKAYEIAFSEMLNKVGGKLTNVKVEEDGVDITFQIGKDTIKLETKLDTDALFGSPQVFGIYDFILNGTEINFEWATKEQNALLNEGLKPMLPAFKAYVDKLKELNGVVQKDGSILISEQNVDPLYKKDQSQALFEKTRTYIALPWDIVNSWYSQNNTDIINILEIGAFNLKENPGPYSAYLPEFATYTDGVMDKGMQARGVFYSSGKGENKKIKFKFVFEIKNAAFKDKLTKKGGKQINTELGLETFVGVNTKPIREGKLEKGARRFVPSLTSTADINVVEDRQYKGQFNYDFEINGIDYDGTGFGFNMVDQAIDDTNIFIDAMSEITGVKNVRTKKYQYFAFGEALSGSTEAIGQEGAVWDGKKYVFPESDVKQSLNVFGSLANHFVKQAKEGKLDGIVFTGKEASRRKLYSAITIKFAKQLGWNYRIIGRREAAGGNMYILGKSKFKEIPIERIKLSQQASDNTLFLGAVLNPVVNMKKFDPYEMADIIASELFRDSKKYRNRQKFEYLYKNLTKEEQYQVQKEMRKKNLTPFGRGISVWDFDDTLATTKSNVLYTLPGGITGKLNAEEFAKRGDELLQQGAEFDFSEFEKVMKGAKGPMFEKAMERNKRFGNESVFILTARPANSATAIHEFLKGIGLDIKLENIVGLGNSTAQAKADWVKGMVAEGYNDFYFADDAYKNVKAVQEVLKVADVKSKVQQAAIKFSQTADPKILDKEFNLMLERTKGVKAGAVISPSRAEQLGKGKGRLDLFLPPNAEDFQGLLYKFLGKGKQGNADMKFFKENLFDPFNRAENAMSTFRQQLADNLKILKRELGNIDEDIDAETIKKIEAIGFTPDQAVRVFVWNRLGEDIPDLTKQEKAKILSVVRRDASLMRYARELSKITEQFGGYPPPSKSWFAGNSTSDLYQYANENVRAKYLEQWQANADAIFSPKNMTKIQALYGKDFAKNLKEVLRRMKSGSNRPLNLNDTGSKMLDYINGSVGTIMFLNMRSAVLQTISAVNFLNWHDNNLFAAGKTLLNPKNYVKTFMEIMNSDFLKQRRNGLEINVSEAEIANAVEQSKNKAKAIFSKIIKFGYKPTQFADSFAIAAGGTSFLINRTKTYEKTGMSFAEAREQAFTDFRAIAEENQQSSRTDRTSNIQASNLGRLVFAFNNTPFQMTRLFKKATLDLINGRGDRKTNISKMLYYGAIQNVIFFSLQQAFMAMMFGADEDDKEDIDKRTERLLNSTIDSILRGSGLPGAVISTAKNVIMEYATQEAKGDWRADHGKTLIQALNFSPPLGSKASRIYSALKGRKYEKTDFDALRNQSKIISAITNIPVDRTITKIDNLRVATSEPIETWKRLALFAGWDQWSLGVYDDLKAIEDKEKGKEKKKSRSEIMKEVWRKRKEEDKKHRDSIINTFRKKK